MYIHISYYNESNIKFWLNSTRPGPFLIWQMGTIKLQCPFSWANSISDTLIENTNERVRYTQTRPGVAGRRGQYKYIQTRACTLRSDL